MSVVLVLDIGTFRDSPLLSFDGTCPVAPTITNPDSDCPRDILMLCNGIANCDDCADEVYETCMTYDCSKSESCNWNHSEKSIMNWVWILFFLLDYTRCGNESAQCIHSASLCNGVQDCVNGWDEDIFKCTTAFERERFIPLSKICFDNYQIWIDLPYSLL